MELLILWVFKVIGWCIAALLVSASALFGACAGLALGVVFAISVVDAAATRK